MQIVRKISIGLLVLPLFFIALSNCTQAQGQDGVSLEVKQTIDLSEKSTSIRYEFGINNQSENFVKNFSFSPGYTTSNSSSNERIVDFSKDPIAPGESRTHAMNFQSSKLVEVYGDYKRVRIPKFSANINLSDFETELYYPDNWGEPSYSSFVSNSNDETYMLWGDSVELQFDLNFKVQGGTDNLAYPFFVNDDQEIYLNSYSGVDSISFENKNSYLLLDKSDEVSMQGIIQLNNLSKYGELEGKDLEIIEKILEELKNNYQINDYWDRLNLCVEFSKKISKEGYESRTLLGLDLQSTNIDRLKPVCWNEISTESNVAGIDPYLYLSGSNTGIRSINSDRVVISNIGNNTDLDILNLDFPNYRLALISDSNSIEELQANAKIEIKINPNSIECEKSELELTIFNPTNQIVKVISPEGITKGVLPGKTENYQLSKKELKNCDFQLKYLVGNKEHMKDLSFDSNDCRVFFDIGEESTSIALLTLIIFLSILVLSRVSTRPLRRISL